MIPFELGVNVKLNLYCCRSSLSREGPRPIGSMLNVLQLEGGARDRHFANSDDGEVPRLLPGRFRHKNIDASLQLQRRARQLLRFDMINRLGSRRSKSVVSRKERGVTICAGHYDGRVKSSYGTRV
jgi:hypothetical protein